MEILIRKIRRADAAAIASLSQQLDYKASEKETAERITSIENNPEHLLSLVEVSNQIVGWIHAFVSLHLESNSFVEIGGLVVDENYRKAGNRSKVNCRS